MDLNDALTRLNKLEEVLLTTHREVRNIKVALENLNNENPSLTPLLRAQEVSKILGVDTAHVYALARSGKLPSFKFGKYRRFSVARLDAWIRRKTSL